MHLTNESVAFILVLVLLFWRPLFVAMAEFQELGTTIRIDVFQNATAKWTFETRINLTDVDQTEAFALFIEEQKQNTPYPGLLLQVQFDREQGLRSYWSPNGGL